MKTHAYKRCEVTNHDTVWLYGVCGGATPVHMMDGEDVPQSVRDGYISMFTFDPDRVTCGSCRRTRIFALIELDNVEL